MFKNLFKSRAVKRQEMENKFCLLYKSLYSIQKNMITPNSPIAKELEQRIADKIIRVIKGFELVDVEKYSYLNLKLAIKSLSNFYSMILKDEQYKQIINLNKIVKI